MKWIKFDDMIPPVGLHIFVTNGRGEVGVLIWDEKYIDNPDKFISLHKDNWSCARKIYDLTFWVPVNFLSEFLPDAFDSDDLKDEDNWLIEHKEHPYLAQIKALSRCPAINDNKTTFKHACGCAIASYAIVFQISVLFDLINNPKNSHQLDMTFEYEEKEGELQAKLPPKPCSMVLKGIK